MVHNLPGKHPDHEMGSLETPKNTNLKKATTFSTPTTSGAPATAFSTQATNMHAIDRWRKTRRPLESKRAPSNKQHNGRPRE